MRINRELLINALQSSPLRKDKTVILMTKQSEVAIQGKWFNMPFLQIMGKEAIVDVMAESPPPNKWWVKVNKEKLIEDLKLLVGKEIDIEYEHHLLKIAEIGDENATYKKIIIRGLSF